ncbi:hypothetical protein HanIR_Chr14g0687231 [Helianthus annuus]|nr:hypothetical protein HanIR_Chr14g0687231 [Helianthus annuus]
MNLCFSFTYYASAVNLKLVTFFWSPIVLWLVYLLNYVVQYDWWLDPGLVTPQSGDTPRGGF